MGIHGLTTFIQRYHEKYKEKIYLRDCPVIVDGCNLMFYLYFQGRQGLPSTNTNSKRSSTGKGAGGSPLSKPSPLKSPHLFGGDYMCYSQNVREFFQHLKLCNITPIVMFDGAYDAMKIKTAFKRFQENIKDNVRSSGYSLKGVTPGPCYSPIFMKAVFIEILQEQKIIHYQTEEEADCTIAFIARKLGNCPILSSDSDFHIYLNAIILPLPSLKFKKVTPQKSKINSTKISNDNNDKHWTLHSEYVSLAKLCREEFKMTETRMLPLAAVILGNDWIRTSAFSNFHSKTSGGSSVRRNTRIAYLLKWLGKQRSYDRVVAAMLATVKDSRREHINTLVNEIIAIYEGLHGEEKLWNMLKSSGQVDSYLVTDSSSLEIVDDLTNLSISDKINCESNDLMNCSGLVDFESEENDDDSPEVSLNDHDIDSDNDELCSKIESQKNQLKLPEWYIDSHINCILPTYLLKLARNRMVFLSPQAEVSSLISTHALSTRIIQVIGGILLGESQKITLVSRKSSQLTEVQVETISKLDKCGILPRVTCNSEDFRKSLCSESRSLLVLETLGIYSPESINFITQWPVSLRIWIVCLLYFRKSALSESLDENEDNSTTSFIRKTVTPVALGILLSVIKNVVLSPSGSNRNSESQELQKISDLLNQSNPVDLSNLRKFYTKYEIVVDASSRNFTRSYDITRTYNLSRFTCILFHVHQLNRLLGDPFKSPRLNYNLNNWFVYNFSGELTVEDGSYSGSESDYGNFIADICGVKEIGIVVDKVIEFSS